MNEIKLSVEDKNLDTVLTILQSLKAGLIFSIDTDDKLKTKNTQYKPKTNTIIKEENSGTSDTTGKYAKASVYKQRLKKKNYGKPTR